MELKDLVGKHELSGVDESYWIVNYGYGDENCQVLNFVLDGKTFSVIENPEDGYRSSMREIVQSDICVSNIFPTIEVLAVYKEKRGYDEADILEFYDIHNNKLVLEVGTDDTDNYYPCFVANFIPENMSSNIPKEE